MKNNKIIFGLVVALSLTVGSCSKYDEGPGVSLRTRKERMANDWRVERAYNGSEDVTDSFDQYELSTTRDGAAELTAHYYFIELEYSFTTSGTWAFTNGSEKVVFNYELDAADRTYQVLRLEEDHLWLREDGTDLELHLVPR